MDELALHILDIIQNSISAKATLIFIEISEKISEDRFEIKITDNGRGIEKQMLDKVTDPYVTSRTSRKVGLGLPLFKQSAEMTGGSLKIDSIPGKGTSVTAIFGYSHIDRPVLGDIGGIIAILAMSNPEIDFVYKHSVGNADYIFDTREVKKALDDVKISTPLVKNYLVELINENLKDINASN